MENLSKSVAELARDSIQLMHLVFHFGLARKSDYLCGNIVKYGKMFPRDQVRLARIAESPLRAARCVTRLAESAFQYSISTFKTGKTPRIYAGSGRSSDAEEVHDEIAGKLASTSTCC